MAVEKRDTPIQLSLGAFRRWSPWWTSGPETLEDKIVSVLFSEDNFERLERKLQAYRMKLTTRQVEEIPRLKLKLAEVEKKVNRVVGKVVEALLSDQ